MIMSLLDLPISFFLFLFFFFFILSSADDPLSFKISRFDPDATNILYEGDAIPSVGAIEFNKVNYLCRVGRAIYAERFHLWDSTTGRLSDFTSYFTFFVTIENTLTYGNGFAFFLAPVGFQIPPNSVGGFLGLYNTTISDAAFQNQIVHVEFDSFVNPEWDPPVQHVGINNNSIASGVYAPWNASSHSGENANVWVTYNATTKNLSVFWNYEENPNFQNNSTLSYQVDLMKILPEWVIIGFSAATGQNVERHTLVSWEFNSTLETKVGGGKGVNIRLVVGLVVSVAVLIGGACIALVILWRKRESERRRKANEKAHVTSITGDFERGVEPKKFSYRELASATNNFSGERKLGEGGFGGVYKGLFTDLNLTVAVKKISRGSKQGRKEYTTEVKIISRLRHRNLVQLIGWSHDRGEFLLVYEFMPNGSLDSHLYGNKNPLSWAVRYKIALGLASALLYLHEEWEQCVLHRDIKSSNIMLDSGFNVKLGDFGLACLMDHELGQQTTGVAGTPGYLAPEYISTGKASKKSDVFSFGVVALEIASGRKSTVRMEDGFQVELVKWVWEIYGRGQLLAAVDGRLCNDFEARQLECLIIVGLWCAHPDSNLRPSIRQAIQVLNCEAMLPNLPLEMPAPQNHVPGPAASCGEPTMTCSTIDVGR